MIELRAVGTPSSAHLILIVALLIAVVPAQGATYRAEGLLTNVYEQDIYQVGDPFTLEFSVSPFHPLPYSTHPALPPGVYDARNVLVWIELDSPSYPLDFAMIFPSLSATAPIYTAKIENGLSQNDPDLLTIGVNPLNGYIQHGGSLSRDGRHPISIIVEFKDEDGQVFASDDLPLPPFNRDAFDTARMEILFSKNWTSQEAIDAHLIVGEITSVTLIPEPASLALLGLAGLALVRRRA